MNRVIHTILILTALSAFSGCDTDEKFNTSHPDKGGVILTVDWSAATGSPATFQARVVYPSGGSKVFENLGGTTNMLVVEPGDATIYVYNVAEQITVTGSKARVNTVSGGVAPNPGLFFSHYAKVFTERDMDITHNAVMHQQTGELKFTFAIKPADMIDRVKTVHAVLEGVASEVDMQTGELSVSSVIQATCTKSAYYATATARLLGFYSAEKQNLKLDVELENGNRASITTDISELVSRFNDSKNALFTLNADLYISGEQSPVLTVDRWEHNTESSYLSASPSEIDLSHVASTESITVTTDRQPWVYSIIQSGDWLTVEKSDDRLLLAAAANTDESERQATVNISAGGLSESVLVTQQSNTNISASYFDMETLKLQSAATGKGVNIVFMGDGYTLNDMDKGSGKYEKDMRTAADYFFSVYPLNRYRDHFNVYMIAAISNEEGISVESTDTYVDNRFETVWEGGRSTTINCNADIVIEYLNAITELDAVDIHDILVVMPINQSVYAGTCYMYYRTNFVTDYANGFAISMCTVGSQFRDLIVHEAGGHGFAKLADEYVYYPKDEIPDEEKSRINTIKAFGWYENVDLFGDINRTSWKGFAGNPKYSMVGAFEGADTYGIGIWRPEYNSCMNDNTLYFNAPSRWAQVRRIMRLGGISYSFSQFLSDDIVPEYPAAIRSFAEKDFIPLAPPVLKDFNEIRTKR